MTAAQVHDWLLEHYGSIEVSERTVSRYVNALRLDYGIKKTAKPRDYEAMDELPMGHQMQLDFGVKNMSLPDRPGSRKMKAALKRGVNQFLEMELDTTDWKISEEKIKEAERYDGYYAVITNNQALSTQEITSIYHSLWKIEESFRILKTDLEARPVYVHTDKHIKGHFVLCYLALCMVRYTQYLVL